MRTGLAAQAPQAFANLGRALAAVGVGPGQIAKIMIYIAGHRHEYLPAIDAARARSVRGPQTGR
jgi:enamine deaminase RidA (YjgF/YER057c/UK114 family)